MALENNRRDYTMDMVKGVAILAMIVGHMSKTIRFEIFSFHMPLFFIVAGIFFTPKEPLTSLKNDFKRLIVPFLLSVGVLLIAELITWLVSGDNSRLTKLIFSTLFPSGTYMLGDKIASMAIWFLFAMFWCKTTFNILVASRLKDFYILIAAIVLAFLAILCDRHWFDLPLAILPGVGALLFFSIGVTFKRYGYKRWKNLLPLLVVFMLCWLLLLFFSKSKNNVNISMVDNYYRMMPVDVICAVGGTFFIWVLCRYIFTHFTMLGKFLAFCGMNSLLILCVHLIDLKLPVRHMLGVNASWKSILFSCGVSLLACVVLWYIPAIRKIFGIRHWKEIEM